MKWMQLEPTLFPGQQANERICMETRQHWMVFLIKLIIWLMFVAILMLTDWAITQYAPVLKGEPYVHYVNLIKSVYLMFLILGLLIMWVMYYLNVQIITNERIVDITQRSLIHHTISELHLSRIEDVTAEVKGIFGTFLDYGNVYVQTAGETERFVFDRVPNPTAVSKMILDLYEALPKEHKNDHDK
jgi:hypothetical protein